MALDTFSRRCPPISPPERITLVSIDEADYQSVGEFPLSDRVLVQTLTALQSYEPRVIGLNIERDLGNNAGEPRNQSESTDASANSPQTSLLAFVQSAPNLVVAEQAFALDSTINVALPTDISAERVGFIDSRVDSDGELRRSR